MARNRVVSHKVAQALVLVVGYSTLDSRTENRQFPFLYGSGEVESHARRNGLNILPANSFTYSLQSQLFEFITDAGRPIYMIKSSNNDRARLYSIPGRQLKDFGLTMLRTNYVVIHVDIDYYPVCNTYFSYHRNSGQSIQTNPKIGRSHTSYLIFFYIWIATQRRVAAIFF